MKSCKRILSSVMALMLVLSLGSFAMAETTDHTDLKLTAVEYAYSIVTGNELLINLQLQNESGAEVYYSVEKAELIGAKNFSATVSQVFPAAGVANKQTLAAGGTGAVQVVLGSISGSEFGITKLKLTLKVYADAAAPTGVDYAEYVVKTTSTTASSLNNSEYLSINVTTDPSTGGGNDGGGSSTPGSAFRLSPVDANGTRVNAPSGNYGDKVTVRIPLVAKASVSSVTISPVITTSLDTFPFVISNVDYTLSYPGPVNAGQIIMFEYTFTLSKKVTAGVKQIDFAINATGGSWDPVGTTYTDKVSIFLTVVKGATATDGTGTPPAVSTPKLIVQSYSFSTDKLYAGETFDVTIVLRNTSETETIQNLQIHIEDATNTVLPASAGSNTLYVAKIGKGETHTETISLQSTPGAEAKAYTMSLEMDYEAASTKTAYKASETIAVPILQKIRVKADNPIVYDEAWVGSPCAMYIAFYNLGKSTVYNCTISVEGEGITMEEGYFGGNVASGSTMNADFTIIPSVAGDISANVVIAYEDVYGEAYELKMPVSLYVNDSGNMGGDGGIVDGGVIEPMPGVDGKPINGEMPIDGGMQQGMPTWVWIAIGVAVAAGAVVLIVLLKRRRKKELEEI